MLEILEEVEWQFLDLIKNSKLTSMYIDYHDPIVKRIWFQYGDYRVYLHKIYPCKNPLLHPHPWESAIRIIYGEYEMGVGHSNTEVPPSIDCKLILSRGSAYEMTSPDGWHYVNPINHPSYSIMVTGKRFERPMPMLPNKKQFETLSDRDHGHLLSVFKNYYDKF